MALHTTVGRRRAGPGMEALLLLLLPLFASLVQGQYDDRYDELNGPCADYQPGEDDLQAFDFIRKFRLDVLEQSYPGVTRVRGSNRMQTAYRLSTDADLQIATRDIFPLGLPQEFSLICTYRAKRPPRGRWDIIRISDLQGRPQFAISLNQKTEDVAFSILSFDGTLQTLLFNQAKPAFNNEWHKLHFGVFRDRVVLYLDCERTTEVPLDPFGPIDINGNIHIAKQQNSERTVPVCMGRWAGVVVWCVCKGLGMRYRKLRHRKHLISSNPLTNFTPPHPSLPKPTTVPLHHQDMFSLLVYS